MNEIPTLKKIKEEVKGKISFNGSISSLRKVMLNIGFEFAKVDGKRFLMERSDVSAARTSFRRDVKEVKQSSNDIVYLDETWINQN